MKAKDGKLVLSRWILPVLLGCGLLLNSGVGSAQDFLEQARRRHEEISRDFQNRMHQQQEQSEERARRVREEYEQRMRSIQVEAEQRQRELQAAWAEREKAIREKWGTVQVPGPKVKVEYTTDDDAFGKVDYQNGYIEAEAVVPAEEPDASRKAEKMLAERLAALLLEQSEPGVRDLKGQVQMPGTDRAVREDEVQAFAKRVARKSPPAGTFVAPDGVKRVLKRIRVELMPDYLKKRAGQYLPHVERVAAKYGVAPELVMAVMESESFFNPRARSHTGAIGLMQLMPEYGALDASRLVFGQEMLVPLEQLYDPEINIELGIAYLSILQNDHFRHYTREPVKLRYLVIAAYNCGPGRVKGLLDGQSLQGISAGALYRLLQRRVPKETKGYLDQVTRRINHYRASTG